MIDSASRDASPRDASPPVEIRTNVGGPAHEGIDYPGSWVVGSCSPNSYTTAGAIMNTADDALFYTHAWGNPLLCTVGSELPVGNYRLRLYFAEVYFGDGCAAGGIGVGSRVFDIELEGITVKSNVDVFALAGCALKDGRPLVETFDLMIADGSLDIRMPATANNGMVSAIELVSLF